MKDMLVDKRIVERNIENGTLDKKVYEKYCADLPDLTDECEEIEASLYQTDEEEEEQAEGEASEDEAVAPESQSEG